MGIEELLGMIKGLQRSFKTYQRKLGRRLMNRLAMMFMAVAVLMAIAENLQAQYETEMISLSLSGSVGGFNVEVRESSSIPSTGIANFATLGGNSFDVTSFFDVFYEVSVDGAPYIPGVGSADVITSLPVVELAPGGGGTWDTEMVSLSLSGDVGGFPVVVRLDPNNPSLGTAEVVDIGSGNFEINSFFDVFVEVSVSGSPFLPAAGSAITRLITPEPTSCLLAGIGGVWLLCGRRRGR